MIIKLFALLIFMFGIANFALAAQDVRFWNTQAMDSMKYSRDLAREKLDDRKFIVVIDSLMAKISETGATHVAIATPYDAEFLPFLRRWVVSARRHNLKIWFRGNFSGWEGWFNYAKISRDEHLKNTELFILGNKSLFEDGDIFIACPECENGGPGDPRFNGDLKGHRDFLISEHNMMARSFRKIGKDVIYNYNSMNGDVAFLVMDERTTQALGGVITIDHYVRTTDRLIADIKKLSVQAGGAKIVLGEFGAPIPDIHGKMTPADQAKWIEDALTELSGMPEVIGINYWTSVGGSTELWDSKLRPRPAVEVIANFFKPPVFNGKVVDEFGNPISGASVKPSGKTYLTNADGYFAFPYITDMDMSMTISKEAYDSKFLSASPEIDGQTTILQLTDPTFWSMLLKAIKHLANILTAVLSF